MSFNKVILLGNLTKDPELRQTQGGTSVCRFSIAVNENYTAKDGTRREDACFVDVDSFGKAAENIAKYFSKGRSILVEGKLRQDTWEDRQTGQKRSKILVAMERFEFICGVQRDGGGNAADAARQDGRGPVQQELPKSDWAQDDDIPF